MLYTLKVPFQKSDVMETSFRGSGETIDGVKNEGCHSVLIFEKDYRLDYDWEMGKKQK